MADSIKDADKRAAKLRTELNRHNHLYHVLDAPEITDAEYDALYLELLALEEEHPELVRRHVPRQQGEIRIRDAGGTADPHQSSRADGVR